jgi:hypothetical protein
MSKEKEERLFRNIGRIIRRRNQIKEERDSNLLSRETILKDINKINMLRMNPKWKTPWGKGEDHQSNVGDVKKITCTNISLIEKKNEDIAQHSRGYHSGRHGKKYSKDICIPRRSTSRTSIPYD